MHTLKTALGKESEANQYSLSAVNPSKTFSKSKNGSMWALDPEDDEQQKVKDSNQKRAKEFELKIMNAFQKDSTFSEIIFFEIIQQMQNLSEDLDQLTRLQLAQKAANKLIENSQQSLKVFLTSFLQCLIRRIKKLKKKEKKTELLEYDKIVKGNFKKMSGAVYIDEANLDSKETAAKPIRNSGISSRPNRSKSIGENSSSKRNGSASSNEGKLGKLISSGTLKQEKKQEENEEAQTHEESVTFSSVVTQSMVVRQRRTKEPKKDKKQKQEVPQKLEQKQSEGNDEAFIFYRPKAGKKK